MFQNVTLSGFYPPHFDFTFNLAAGVTAAHVGCAVAIDLAQNNAVKMPADNERVVGVLRSFENRVIESMVVGGVNTKASCTLKYNGVIAVGDSICGSATPNEVKKAAAANRTIVTSVDTVNKLIEVTFD